ncbi:TonB-dependent receptor [Sphingobium chlorophenolicum L-1]|uniref:TonB-dependent receptor n=1 Tax=Sphingobium chlorophenolicum L-1 TaxID=690566 RepID=F6ETN8_SPHCR|nr:TonB-dependent receptor [Sphingobium chlorophenolicum]AEG49533.1 TonB-dependent receptor [Sphingobium chlorophenolicum L-1]
MRSLAVFVTCSTLAMSMGASSAYAQQSPPDPSVVRAANTSLGEIVVTAQRRSQNLQTVGISIAAVNEETITEQRIQQATDLSRVVPGLQTSYATSDATPLFSVRGVGLDDFNPNNSSGVGVYVDDVYQSQPVFLIAPFFDVGGAEVLKGPQGTLYGRNTTGGAINVTSKGPTDEWDGYASLGYGRFETVDAQGAVGGPLATGITFRLAGTLTQQGRGFQTDIDTGRRYGKTKRGAIRAQLRFDLGGNSNLLLIGRYAADRSTPQSAQSNNVEEAADAFFGTTPGVLDYLGYPIEGLLNGVNDPRKVRVGNLRPFIHSDSYGGTGKLSLDVGVATLISISAYDKNKTSGIDNIDGTPVAETDFYNDYRAEQWSQELRLISKPSSPLKWVVGAAYGEDRLDYHTLVDLSFAVLADNIQNVVGLDGNYLQKTKSFGVYGNVEVPLLDRLTAVLGARYGHDRRSFDGITTDASQIYAPSGLVASLDEAHSTSRVLYRVGLNFQATDTLLVYGSFASGYKAGAFYGSSASAQDTWGYVKPESVTAFEAGFKSRWFDQKFQLNAAYFHTDYKDRQSSVVAVGGAGVYATLANIPKAKIDGFEWEIAAKPISGLQVGFSGTYLDARVTEGLDVARGGVPLLHPIVAGEQLAQAPKWSYAVSGRYDVPLSADLTLTAGANWAWSDKTVSFLADTQADYGPIRNLSANIELASSSGWSGTLWANNITKSANRTYSFTDIFGERGYYLQKPRTYGVTVRRDF